MHERFTADEIRAYRKANPGIVVLSHPECPPEVVAESDFSGSTSAMIGYVGEHRPAPRRDGHGMLDERPTSPSNIPMSNSCGRAICART